MRNTQRSTFTNIFHWPTTIILFLLCYILNCHVSLFFSLISNIVFVVISSTMFLQQSRKSINLDFDQQKKFRYQISITPTHWTLKDRAILGSADSGEVDIDSDVNFLASGNLRQSTTAPSHCERLPWNWTWCLMYFNRWSHLKNLPGIFLSIPCNKLSLHQRASKVEFIKWKMIHRRWLIISVLQSILLHWFI